MQTKILKATPKNIKFLARSILKGDLVGIPTETVYGLAANLWDERALLKIFKSKERPKFDPLIAHIKKMPPQKLPKYFKVTGLCDWDALSPKAQKVVLTLAKKFWPGPLTLVLPKTKRVPDLATSGLDTVGIRMPKHKIAQALLRNAHVPLAAPSANRYGNTSPTRSFHVMDELKGRIKWILEGGPCQVGLESTVISVEPSGRKVIILRPGKVSQESLSKVLFSIKTKVIRLKNPPDLRLAPGLASKHYAPKKKFYRMSAAWTTSNEFKKILKKIGDGNEVGFILFYTSPKSLSKTLLNHLKKPYKKEPLIYDLNGKTDWSKAARSFFSILRKIDSSKVQFIFAETPRKTQGLELALFDRVNRASLPLAK